MQQNIHTKTQKYVQIINGKPGTTSLIIAKAFDKRHEHVLRAIEADKIPNDFFSLNFAIVEIIERNAIGGPVKKKMYNITKDGAIFLIMGFTGEKAAKVKIEFIRQFNELDAKLARMQEQGDRIGFAQGLTLGVRISDVANSRGITMDDLAKIRVYRSYGLSQLEVAKIFGFTHSKIQEIENDLKELGIDPPVKMHIGRKLDAIRDEFLNGLRPAVARPDRTPPCVRHYPQIEEMIDLKDGIYPGDALDDAREEAAP